MPAGDLEGNRYTSIATRARASRRPSGTLPPEPVSASYRGIYDSRIICATYIIGLIEIYPMTRRAPGGMGRLRAPGGGHCATGTLTGKAQRPRPARSFDDSAAAGHAFQRAPGTGRGHQEFTRGGEQLAARHPRRAPHALSDSLPRFIGWHSEQKPYLDSKNRQDVLQRALVIASTFRSRVSMRNNGTGLLCADSDGADSDEGGKQMRDPRPAPSGGIHVRAINRACRRLPRLRKKYNRHEQTPRPLVGQSCGASPSPQITPISGPFPGDIDHWAYVPGPLTGDIGRGPGTRAHSPGRTPPNSHGKCALTRCVVGWVESGYVKRGAHDTRHLSSCLVRSTGISVQMRWSHGGR